MIRPKMVYPITAQLAMQLTPGNMYAVVGWLSSIGLDAEIWTNTGPEISIAVSGAGSGQINKQILNADQWIIINPISVPVKFEILDDFLFGARYRYASVKMEANTDG